MDGFPGSPYARARLRNCKRLPEDHPITNENRTFLSFKKPMEILSLSGNVSMAETEPLVHAHVTLSRVEGDEIGVLGGHLLEGCTVFGFSEVFIMELEGIEMVKRFDEETRTLQLFFLDFEHSERARSELCIIPDSGHTVMIEKPQEFNQILEEFIR